MLPLASFAARLASVISCGLIKGIKTSGGKESEAQRRSRLSLH
jgi:hypothetical protein